MVEKRLINYPQIYTYLLAGIVFFKTEELYYITL